MEKQIDLINAYLNKSLSESEVITFENRLKTDSDFNAVYEEQLIIINGIDRVELKDEINNAKQSYVRAKLLKYFGILIGIIIFSILAFGLISKTQNTEKTIPIENNTVEFATDSIKIEQNEQAANLVDTISTEDITPKPKTVTTTIKEVEAVIAKKKTVNNNTTNLKDIITFFFKEPEFIKVKTEENFKITLKEGTKISIPKNAFVNVKTGKQVSGEIDLKITEFY